MSGRVAVRGHDEPLLLLVDRQLLRVPQLEIHLDRGVNDTGLKLNPQQHLTPHALASAVAEDAREFAGGDLSDDVAVVAIRRA